MTRLASPIVRSLTRLESPLDIVRLLYRNPESRIQKSEFRMPWRAASGGDGFEEHRWDDPRNNTKRHEEGSLLFRVVARRFVDTLFSRVRRQHIAEGCQVEVASEFLSSGF